MTAKDLARAVWPYINDELFCQDAIHACFARLVEKHGLRKAFEMVNHALANEMLGTTGGKI